MTQATAHGKSEELVPTPAVSSGPEVPFRTRMRDDGTMADMPFEPETLQGAAAVSTRFQPMACPWEPAEFPKNATESDCLYIMNAEELIDETRSFDMLVGRRRRSRMTELAIAQAEKTARHRIGLIAKVLKQRRKPEVKAWLQSVHDHCLAVFDDPPPFSPWSVSVTGTWSTKGRGRYQTLIHMVETPGSVVRTVLRHPTNGTIRVTPKGGKNLHRATITINGKPTVELEERGFSGRTFVGKETD